jgi:hypothetical protein
MTKHKKKIQTNYISDRVRVEKNGTLTREFQHNSSGKYSKYGQIKTRVYRVTLLCVKIFSYELRKLNIFFLFVSIFNWYPLMWESFTLLTIKIITKKQQLTTLVESSIPFKIACELEVYHFWRLTLFSYAILSEEIRRL